MTSSVVAVQNPPDTVHDLRACVKSLHCPCTFSSTITDSSLCVLHYYLSRVLKGQKFLNDYQVFGYCGNKVYWSLEKLSVVD